MTQKKLLRVDKSYLFQGCAYMVPEPEHGWILPEKVNIRLSHDFLQPPVAVGTVHNLYGGLLVQAQRISGPDWLEHTLAGLPYFGIRAVEREDGTRELLDISLVERNPDRKLPRYTTTILHVNVWSET